MMKYKYKQPKSELVFEITIGTAIVISVLLPYMSNLIRSFTLLSYFVIMSILNIKYNSGVNTSHEQHRIRYPINGNEMIK